MGEGDQLRRPRLRPGARMGLPERRGLGPRVRRRRPAARRDPRDLRLERRAHRGRRRQARARARRARLRDRRVGPQRPDRDARPGAGRLQLRRRLVRRLSPLAAGGADRRPRRLLRGLRPPVAAGQGNPPPARRRRRLLPFSAPALRRPGRRRPGAEVRRLLPEPRSGRQPRIRRPDAGAGAAAGGLLHPAVAVRAAAVHGRGVRRAGAVSVLLKPHRRGDRGRDARRPPARVRGVRFV